MSIGASKPNDPAPESEMFRGSGKSIKNVSLLRSSEDLTCELSINMSSLRDETNEPDFVNRQEIKDLTRKEIKLTVPQSLMR